MSKETAKMIHLIYGVVVSVLVIILGAALIASGLHIYRSDPTGDPYNPGSIRTHYQNISLLLYITLGAILGGILLCLFFPAEKEKTRPIRNQWQLMKQAARKAGSLSQEQSLEIRKERVLRGWIGAGCIIIVADFVGYCAIYLTLIANFAVESALGDILQASIIVLFCGVLGLSVCHLGNDLIQQSLVRQTGIYKSAPKGTPTALPPKNCRRTICVIRSVIAVLAIVLIVAGVFNGSAKDVLNKAIKICTECIGLG